MITVGGASVADTRGTGGKRMQSERAPEERHISWGAAPPELKSCASVPAGSERAFGTFSTDGYHSVASPRLSGFHSELLNS